MGWLLLKHFVYFTASKTHFRPQFNISVIVRSEIHPQHLFLSEWPAMMACLTTEVISDVVEDEALCLLRAGFCWAPQRVWPQVERPVLTVINCKMNTTYDLRSRWVVAIA